MKNIQYKFRNVFMLFLYLIKMIKYFRYTIFYVSSLIFPLKNLQVYKLNKIQFKIKNVTVASFAIVIA